MTECGNGGKCSRFINNIPDDEINAVMSTSKKNFHSFP